MAVDKLFNTISLKVNVLNDTERKIVQGLKDNDKLYGISDTCVDILYNRGLKTEEDIKKFLYSTIEDTHSPLLLKDSDKFLNIVIDTIEKGLDIVIYTDYDTDGVTSGAIMINGLRNICSELKSQSKINYYTNNRFIEGYGITPKGVEMLVDKYPNVKLIITTDNGIVGFKGIEKAISMGVKVIVTDHHEQGEELPLLASAIINPKRKDCSYPFKGLCGAGVAFKLMQLLYWELNLDPSYVINMLDILAVGTVGDLVPLVDENRIFVKEGIKYAKEERRIAFRKLRETLNITSLDEETFGFAYAPLLNALGRITGSPDEGIELFTTDDEDRITEIVNRLNEINTMRKTLTKEQVELAKTVAEDLISSNGVPNVIVLTHKDFHEGVIGLVATKIRDIYHRPTIILAEHEKNVLSDSGEIIKQVIYKGSARSILGFNIKSSFDNVSEFLLGYGGHEMAGGLSLCKECLDDFIKSINDYALTILKPEHFKKEVLIDSSISASDITVDFINDIQILKPFGMGFPKPKFGLKDFALNTALNQKIFIGNDLSHIRLVSEENLTLIMFNGADRYTYLSKPQNIKAVGYPVLNIYRNNAYPQFMVEGELLFKV